MKRDKKETQRENLNNSEDDSSSSEDDENAELWTEELEEGFFKVLSQLKKKDSKLYEESVKYFPSEPSEGDSQLDLKTWKTEKKSLEEYRDWLKGQKEKVENKEVRKELKALHDFWTSPSLNKDEVFLRDYILNEKFLEPDDSFNIEEEINKLSDEEREVEEQLLYEHKYNCRFENPDGELVLENESKTKKKRKKASKEVSVHENDDSLHSESTPRVEKVDNDVEETKMEHKRKKKKKKNQNLENGSLEETEEIKKEENATKKEDGKDTLAEDADMNPENNRNLSQADASLKIKKSKNKNSRKRKRSNCEQINEEKPTLNISCSVDTNKTERVHPKKKSKKERNLQKLEVSGTGDTREKTHVFLSKNKQKQMNNLPRNLQMKNKKGIKKMRHRNKNKVLWMKMNNVTEETGGNKDLKVEFNVKKGKKKAMFFNHQNKNVDGARKQNNFQTKKITLSQNIILKEKKNKELKFGKMLSKKQKAALAQGKS